MQMNAADGGDWKEGLVVSGKRSKSDGKEGLVGFGKRCRSSRSSSDLQEELDKCSCLFGYPSSDGPVLYCFNLDEKSQSKRNFGRRRCADLFGEDKAAEDKPPELVGMRLLTSPPSNKLGLTPDCSMTVPVRGTVVYALGGSSEDPEKEGRWLYSNKVFYFDTNHPRKGWIQGPDMLNKRHGGKAVDVEVKRVSRPRENEWEPIPPPPKRFGMHKSDLCITPSFAAAVLEKRWKEDPAGLLQLYLPCQRPMLGGIPTQTFA
ncbi:hypothetical protein RHMOL_Rhmol03G0187800 [Rhododendron molle]|uniref:Uncharacterized protein n=1 Tax=Rhododendron molle TaxID=49168 RepID=A0ACC0PJ35_RHOML|nr:hypothetical protein RHMOL_Rhmol03G0187800 [Rhododendron molle]